MTPQVALLLGALAAAPSLRAAPTLHMRQLAALTQERDDAPTIDPVEPLVDRPEEPRRPPRPHYVMTVAETALALVGGTMWYWRNQDFNSRDWALHWDTPSWRKKLVTFEAVRFDDNEFDTNALWHPLDGTGIYLLARGNHLGPLPSLAVTAASSVLWEYVVEFREYPSVNDMIFTPLAGFAVGEPAVRLAQFLRAGSDGPVADTLAALLDPVGAVNEKLEDRDERGPTGAWGLPRGYRHRLELSVGYGQTSFGAGRQRSESELAADLFLDSVPGYGTAGRTRRLVGPGALTFLRGGGALDEGRMVDARVASEVAVVGTMWRRFDESLTREPYGQSLFLGLASGFEYSSRVRPLLSDDQLAIARLVGPMVDWSLARGAFTVHAEADASWNFAMVHALAGDEYLAIVPPDALPTVLARERYYFAQGLSVTSRLLAQLGRWETGVQASEDDFRPLYGLDRNGTTAGPPAADRRAMRRAWVGVRPWRSMPFKLTAAADQVARQGRLDTISTAVSETRLSTALSLLF